MPVVGTPTAATILSRDKIRRFMRDYAGQVKDTGVINILLDNVEFSDADVADAIEFTVDYYTALPPIIGTFTEASIPSVVLLYGVSAHLLSSEAIRQLRNQATVQDGDVQPIGIDDKYQLYQNASNWMKDQFKEMAQRIKIQLNMRGAYGGLASGFANTARNHSA
jgi:hypothetical protein